MPGNDDPVPHAIAIGTQKQTRAGGSNHIVGIFTEVFDQMGFEPVVRVAHPLESGTQSKASIGQAAKRKVRAMATQCFIPGIGEKFPLRVQPGTALTFFYHFRPFSVCFIAFICSGYWYLYYVAHYVLCFRKIHLPRQMPFNPHKMPPTAIQKTGPLTRPVQHCETIRY